MCLSSHCLHIPRTRNIRNGENQLLLGTINPHKAVSTQTISRWLVHVLSLTGIDKSTFNGHSTNATSRYLEKAMGVSAKLILKRSHWYYFSTFEKHRKDIINQIDRLSTRSSVRNATVL